MPPDPAPLRPTALPRPPVGWSRRRILRAAAGATLAFPFLVDGCWRLLTPRAAWAAGARLRILSRQEGDILAAAAETLVPGAQEAGILPYLDAQLAADPADSLLILRYLDVPPPWDGFYREAARALDAAAGGTGRFATLGKARRMRILRALLDGRAAGWPPDAPPAGFVLFVLRADAIDVTYGTPEGFARLGIDYLPHIAPARPW